MFCVHHSVFTILHCTWCEMQGCYRQAWLSLFRSDSLTAPLWLDLLVLKAEGACVCMCVSDLQSTCSCHVQQVRCWHRAMLASSCNRSICKQPIRVLHNRRQHVSETVCTECLWAGLLHRRNDTLRHTACTVPVQHDCVFMEHFDLVVQLHDHV